MTCHSHLSLMIFQTKSLRPLALSKGRKLELPCYHLDLPLLRNNSLFQYLDLASFRILSRCNGHSRSKFAYARLLCSKTIFHLIFVTHFQQTGLSSNVRDMYSSFQSFLISYRIAYDYSNWKNQCQLF